MAAASWPQALAADPVRWRGGTGRGYRRIRGELLGRGTRSGRPRCRCRCRCRCWGGCGSRLLCAVSARGDTDDLDERPCCRLWKPPLPALARRGERRRATQPRLLGADRGEAPDVRLAQQWDAEIAAGARRPTAELRAAVALVVGGGTEAVWLWSRERIQPQSL